MSTVTSASDAVSSTFSIADYQIPKETRVVNKELGREQFLQLLITQLANQDPTEPMDNSAMIAQMAQFSALEAMQNMSASFAQTQTYSMIGKVAVGAVVDSTGASYEVFGVVDGAGVLNGKPYVKIGEATVFLENVYSVFDKEALSGNTDLLNAANMVGKYVRIDLSDEEGNVTSLTGRVDKIVQERGQIYLLVNGEKYALFEVKEISDQEITLPPVPEPEKTPETDNTEESGNADTSVG